MSAYAKQKKIKERLGVTEIKRVETVGNKSTWHVMVASGFVHIIEANRLSSETGVLQTLDSRISRARASGQ